MCCGPLHLYVHKSDLEQRQLPSYRVTNAKMAVDDIIVGSGRDVSANCLEFRVWLKHVNMGDA